MKWTKRRVKEWKFKKNQDKENVQKVCICKKC